MTILGCDDPVVGPMMEPVIGEMIGGEQKPVPDNTMVGEVKQPEEAEETQYPEPELLPPGWRATDPVPAKLVEVTYYRDHTLMRAVNTVVVGTTIYSKVVFSNDVPIVFSDDKTAKPHIASDIGAKEFQYRMRPRYVSLGDLRNGDARPYKNTNNIFICKYIPQADEVGEDFFIYIDNGFMAADIWVSILSSTVCEVPMEGLTAFVHEPARQNPSDFIGQVLALVPESVDLYYDALLPVRSYGTPMPGVVVTVVSGPRSGERAVTDADGQYVFPDIREDELHLRVEKECLEPKEVLVHRFRPTTLPNGSASMFEEDPQMHPGVILMGYAWPEGIREVLEQTVLPPDLLLATGPFLGNSKAPAGAFYINDGVVVVGTPVESALYWALIHEIGHAHQHAVALLNGGRSTDDWEHTPEGRDFLAARDADWRTVGKVLYEDPEKGDPDEYFLSPVENSAEIFQYWWREKLGRELIWGPMADFAPNRFRWAEHWLTKRP